MILLPPITREEDLLPAIDLLYRGEAIVVAASFRRPDSLPEEIVWHTEPNQKKLRCVRRKSDAEIAREKIGARFASLFSLPDAASPCTCG